jgi:hypothetical protein
MPIINSLVGVTGVGDEQQPFGSLDELIAYASLSLSIDQTREDFFRRHHEIVSSLLRNQLVGRNRFRELLLGAKSVGKSVLLRVLENYTIEKCPESVLVVFIQYHCDSCGILETVCERILKKYPNIPQSEFAFLQTCFQLSERILEFETLLDTS